MSEQAVQSNIRLAAANSGCMMWRNQSGACYDETGRLIRYGLANDSAQLNKRIKSSDLIGITPVVITQQMVGQTMGVFTAVEVKHPGWTRPTNDRERAQEAFIRLVTEKGGLGGFAASVEDFWRIIRCA